MIRLDSFNTKISYKAEVKVISKADVFGEIKVYSKELILAQKIETLFNRKRSKGRDIYDVVYLFSFVKPDYKYLNNKLKISNKKELINQMKKLFSDKDLKLLAKDVRPFLINPKKVIQVEKFNLWLDSLSEE
jgi:predicted nucleotidyltransferase component of viral defense system